MVLLRVSRKLSDGRLDRPQWMCGIQFNDEEKTIDQAKRAMLKFNGHCEVWASCLPEAKLRFVASNDIN